MAILLLSFINDEAAYIGYRQCLYIKYILLKLSINTYGVADRQVRALCCHCNLPRSQVPKFIQASSDRFRRYVISFIGEDSSEILLHRERGP